jgi:hypothetical protein
MIREWQPPEGLDLEMAHREMWAEQMQSGRVALHVSALMQGACGFAFEAGREVAAAEDVAFEAFCLGYDDGFRDGLGGACVDAEILPPVNA